MKVELPLKDEVYAVLGACFDVYNEIGAGLSEAVFQEALEMELGQRGIPFEAQPELPVFYKGNKLRSGFRPDLVCFGKLVVELKAVSSLGDEHRGQVLNYVRAGGFEVGLLINFGSYPRLQYERFVNSRMPIRVDSRDSRLESVVL